MLLSYIVRYISLSTSLVSNSVQFVIGFLHVVIGRKLVLIVAALLLSPFAWAKEWKAYENAYFTVYSNASDKRTGRLLSELDKFRRAAMTIANIQIPEGAAKPKVFITSSQIELRRYAGNRRVLGFASHIGEQLYIFVSASGRAPLSNMAIRHEYAHVLLRFSGNEYPGWFHEGFAEFLSATEILEDGQSFSIGAPPLRTKYKHNLGFTWEELIAEDRQFHDIRVVEQSSGAYFQAWLLTHFAILGDNRRNSHRLRVYFDELASGASSSDAFENAFGTPISEIWETHLDDYDDSLPIYRRTFDADIAESPFQSIEAVEQDYAAVLEYFALISEPGYRNGPPIARLSILSGKWDVVEIGGICDAPINISVRDNRKKLVFDPYPSSGGVAEKRAIEASVFDDGLLKLESNPDESGELTSHNMIALYKKDLVCLGLWRDGQFSCRQMMTKCDD